MRTLDFLKPDGGQTTLRHDVVRIVQVAKHNGVHTTLRHGFVRTVLVAKPDCVNTTQRPNVVRAVHVAKTDLVHTTQRPRIGTKSFEKFSARSTSRCSVVRNPSGFEMLCVRSTSRRGIVRFRNSSVRSGSRRRVAMQFRIVKRPFVDATTCCTNLVWF